MGNSSRQYTKPIFVANKIHSMMKRIAVNNEIKLYVLANEILERMLTEHKDEVEQIVKEIKIRKS